MIGTALFWIGMALLLIAILWIFWSTNRGGGSNGGGE